MIKNEEKSSWENTLEHWLQTNFKTIPNELRELREEFVRRFPKEKLAEMSLQDYALGQPQKDAFCNWIEFKTNKLGNVGAAPAFKYGVFLGKDGNWHWNSAFKDENEAISHIRTGLALLVDAAEAGKFDELDNLADKHLGTGLTLRCKPLSLYFPNEFLPIFSPAHLGHFLRIFDSKPERAGALAINRQLLTTLQELPEFEGFDTYQLMRFLYDSFAPQKQNKGGIWKIAPGAKASYWPMCRDNQCIVVHWLDDMDFREFADVETIKQALVASGQKTGGAKQIWEFTHELNIGDIVVANQGLDAVVGIGRIASPYIAPREDGNPSQDDKYRHTRAVDWVIKEPVQFSVSSFHKRRSIPSNLSNGGKSRMPTFKRTQVCPMFLKSSKAKWKISSHPPPTRLNK